MLLQREEKKKKKKESVISLKRKQCYVIIFCTLCPFLSTMNHDESSELVV